MDEMTDANAEEELEKKKAALEATKFDPDAEEPAEEEDSEAKVEDKADDDSADGGKKGDDKDKKE